ncbi:MAG: 4-alpha-glucanotransferase [Lachnospiraceae bacterium]|nr:4-alpha-glucanotransferase [Lachnospiraceae bacterium]
MNKRAAGVLLPIFSLSNKYGIGCFSKEAFEFVDFLEKAEQQYWQILPLGPTGYGDSPYQSYSTFAGNPYFIDLEDLVEKGLLNKEECLEIDSEYIDYEKLLDTRFEVLRKAYERSSLVGKSDFILFCRENSLWLDDYALFMALKKKFDGKPWTEWDEDIRLRKADALYAYKEECKDEMNFYKFQQYFFSKQWKKLKKYANEKGIEIIGDIPIYVAFDSSDVWANPSLFDLDEDNLPNAVAGCPPDPFAATGQLWGNPLYDWDYHKKNHYEWWIERVRHCFELYDVVRIDHFRGFDEFYAIPYGDPTAEFGKWKTGPGLELFKAIEKELGKKKIIAEDLGFLTDSVRELVKDTGYPGMKVLLFAFDSTNRCEYLPHMLERNSVVYTGTHDNDTVRGWYEKIEKDSPKTKEYFDNYSFCKSEEDAALCAIKLALSSVCNTCIIPLSDYMNLDNSARINTPSTLGGNWNYKMKQGLLTEELSSQIKDLTVMYGRDLIEE